MKGYSDLVRFLLKSGAVYNSQNNDKKKPSDLAETENMILLFSYIDKNFNESYTPLSSEILDIIFSVRDYRRRTILHINTGEYFFKCAVSEGIDINVLDGDGNPPLRTAGIFYGFQRLIKHGADVNIINNEGHSYIHFAASEGNHFIIRLLVSLGKVPMDEDNYNSILLAGISGGSVEVVKCLLQLGGRVDTENAFLKAITVDDVEVLECLKDYCEEQDIKFGEGGALLHSALTRGKLYSIKWLIDNVIFDPFFADEKGQSMFQAIVSCSALDISNKGRTAIKDYDEFMVLVINTTTIYATMYNWFISLNPKIVHKKEKKSLFDDIGSCDLRECMEAITEFSDIYEVEGAGGIILYLIPLNLSSKIEEILLKYKCHNADDRIVDFDHDICLYLFIEYESNMSREDVFIGTNFKRKKNLFSKIYLDEENLKLKLLKLFMQLSGRDFNELEKELTQLLCTASSYGYLEIIQWLSAKLYLDPGARVKMMHEACASGHCHIVEWLHEQGCVLNCTDDGGQTPLHKAVLKGQLHVAKWLEDHGADVNCTDDGGQTPLHKAVLKRQLHVVKWLVEHGADVTCSDNNGNSVSHLKLNCKFYLNTWLLNYCKQEHYVVYLGEEELYNPYSINFSQNRLQFTGNEYTPSLLYVPPYTVLQQRAAPQSVVIEWLADEIQPDIICDIPWSVSQISASALLLLQWFTSKGVNVYANNNKGETLLHYAVRFGELDIFNWLMEKQLNPDAVTNEGVTPLFECASSGNLDVTKQLAERGGDVFSKTSSGRTLLHEFARHGHLHVLKWLVNRGLDVNAEAADGGTPAFDAVRSGNSLLVEWLHVKGANLHVKRKDGFTLLHQAARYNQDMISAWLINKGVGVNEAADGGLTPLFIAADCGNLEIIQILESNGANIFARAFNEETLLHGSARRGHCDVLKWLLGKGLDVNAKDSDGRTPLFHAAVDGDVDILQGLIARGADVFATTTDGTTLLQEAGSGGNSEIVEFLTSLQEN